MDYLSKNYAPEKLKQRAFILSSFTRQGMTLTVSIYEFTDFITSINWLPPLGNLESVDEEIFKKYQTYVSETK
jgi:hypothetical protein